MNIKLNYTPDGHYPLIICRPSETHKRFYIYEQDEPDPVCRNSFKTADAAWDFAREHFPTFTLKIWSWTTMAITKTEEK